MWGSGTSNGRGPWRTAQGLKQPDLPDVLRTTAQRVAEGDLGAAYTGFKVPGSGEAFFTKWLWATSLGQSDQHRALIFDARVQETLRRLMEGAEGWRERRGAKGYAGYVSLLHSAARELKPTFGGIDPERLEWLMFDRTSHDASNDRCLLSWLRQ